MEVTSAGDRVAAAPTARARGAARRIAAPRARLAVRVLGILVCAVLLERSGDIAGAGKLAGEARWTLLAPAFLLGGLSQLGAAVVWKWLLPEHPELGWRRAMGMFLRATFLGQVLPSAAADAARTAEAGRRVGYGNASAAIVAVHAFSILAMAAWALVAVWTTQGTLTSMIATAAAFGLVAAGASVARRISRRDGTTRTPAGMLRRELDAAGARLRVYSSDRDLMVRAFGASLVGWALSIASLVCFAGAIGTGARWQLFALALPVSLASTMLPITPNGLGVREGVLVNLLIPGGLSAGPALAVALFVDLQALPLVIAGGVLLLVRRRAVDPGAASRWRPAVRSASAAVTALRRSGPSFVRAAASGRVRRYAAVAAVAVATTAGSGVVAVRTASPAVASVATDQAGAPTPAAPTLAPARVLTPSELTPAASDRGGRHHGRP